MDPVQIAEWIQTDPFQNGKLIANGSSLGPQTKSDFEFGGIGDYG